MWGDEETGFVAEGTYLWFHCRDVPSSLGAQQDTEYACNDEASLTGELAGLLLVNNHDICLQFCR